MIVSERALTKAVTAAARQQFEEGWKQAAQSLVNSGKTEEAEKLSQWDDIPLFQQNQWRQLVLPIVWAATQALPDERRGLWLEGYTAHSSGIHDEACPYPLEISMEGL